MDIFLDRVDIKNLMQDIAVILRDDLNTTSIENLTDMLETMRGTAVSASNPTTPSAINDKSTESTSAKRASTTVQQSVTNAAVLEAGNIIWTEMTDLKGEINILREENALLRRRVDAILNREYRHVSDNRLQTDGVI